MNESFDGSFKIYVEPESIHAGADTGRRGPGDGPYTMEMFSTEVNNLKEDLLNLEKLYCRLQECNEEIKISQGAKIMKELRARLNMDLDHVFKLAKQINRKYDALVRANAALRKATGSGPGSSDDEARAAMIFQLVESLQLMTRKFQALKSQMEAEQRQTMEARYFAITREKATAEAIDNLIASEVPESTFQIAMQEHGRAPVMETVVEIQERRDMMREVRRNLMALHQVLLGIATPVTAAAPMEVQGGGNRAGAGPPSPVENFPAAPPPQVAPYSAGKVGTGGLNDYERETRNQAYIAIAIALLMVIALIASTLIVENVLDNEQEFQG